MNDLMKFLLGVSSNAEHVGGLLGKLWKLWSDDVPHAVLLARWHWQELPVELIEQGEVIRRQAQGAAEQSQRNVQEGKTAAAGDPAAGSGMDANQAMFLLTMSVIRAHQGDPPADPGMARLAEDVLTGKLDAVEAMLATSPPPVREQIRTARQLGEMMGVSQALRVQGLLQAAFSLPHERIPPLLPKAG